MAAGIPREQITHERDVLQALDLRGFKLLLSPLGDLLSYCASVTQAGPQPATNISTS